MTGEEAAARYRAHTLGGAQSLAAAKIGNKAAQLALQLDALLGEGREKALALTMLENCVHWAYAALAVPADDDPGVCHDDGDGYCDMCGASLTLVDALSNDGFTPHYCTECGRVVR